VWPDWANFRPPDDCLLWAVFSKIQEDANIIMLLFVTDNVMHSLKQKMGWATIWAIFSQTPLVTLEALQMNSREKVEIFLLAVCD
jgi:hypothetical protein